MRKLLFYLHKTIKNHCCSFAVTNAHKPLLLSRTAAQNKVIRVYIIIGGEHKSLTLWTARKCETYGNKLRENAILISWDVYWEIPMRTAFHSVQAELPNRAAFRRVSDWQLENIAVSLQHEHVYKFNKIEYITFCLWLKWCISGAEIGSDGVMHFTSEECQKSKASMVL